MMSVIKKKTKKLKSREVENDGQGPSWEDSSEAKTWKHRPERNEEASSHTRIGEKSILA